MELKLKRPIVFFDLETTGVDTAHDRIVEISMIKIMPDGERIVKTRKLNPEMHIPEAATAVHGITDEDVKDCPRFAQVAKSLAQFLTGCDFCARESTSTSSGGGSSTYRTYFIKWSSARWLRPISSTAIRS